MEQKTILSAVTPQLHTLIRTLYHPWFWELDRRYRHVAMGPTMPVGVCYLMGIRRPHHVRVEWIEALTFEELAVKMLALVGPELPQLDEALILDTALVLGHEAFGAVQLFPTDPPTFTVWMNGPCWTNWSHISGYQPLAEVMRETAQEIRTPYQEVVDPERPFHTRFWKRTPWPRVWELMKEAGIAWDMFRVSFVVTEEDRLILGRGEEVAGMTVAQIQEVVSRKREERAREERGG